MIGRLIPTGMKFWKSPMAKAAERLGRQAQATVAEKLGSAGALSAEAQAKIGAAADKMIGRMSDQAVASAFPNWFQRHKILTGLGVMGGAGLAYNALSPSEHAEMPISPEAIGAQRAAVDFEAQLQQATAARLNPAFNPASFQISGMGAERMGMVAGPEMAMGRA